jgi:N-acetyl-alpha-D-glucosaminyl L-malate synthase BshA
MYPRKTDKTNGIFVHEQVRHLATMGCDIKVISPIPYTPIFLATNRRRKGYRDTPYHDTIEGIDIHYPRFLRPPGTVFHGLSTYTMYISVQEYFQRFLYEFNPDLIHAHAATPSGYVGILLGKKYNIPVVVTLHGSDINSYPFRDKLTFKLTKKVIENADKVIAVSKALKERAESICSRNKQIKVIYNGFDINKFIFDPIASMNLRTNLGIPKDSVVLEFVGNLIREKGVEELMHSFFKLSKVLSNLYLLIVGDGPYFDKLLSVSKEVGLEKKVYFVGRKNHEEIPSWLNACDIFILPSWSEGHPVSLIEAMACSRPVIATRVGGIPETVVDGVTGILIDKGDIQGLTNAIYQLATNRAMREQMGKAGRIRAEQFFTWEKNAEETMNVYKELLNKS